MCLPTTSCQSHGAKFVFSLLCDSLSSIHYYVLFRRDHCGPVKFRILQLQAILSCTINIVADLPMFQWLTAWQRTLSWDGILDAGADPEYTRELCLPVSSRPDWQLLPSVDHETRWFSAPVRHCGTRLSNAHVPQCLAYWSHSACEAESILSTSFLNNPPQKFDVISITIGYHNHLHHHSSSSPSQTRLSTFSCLFVVIIRHRRFFVKKEEDVTMYWIF